MTKYLDKIFNSPANNKKYRDNYDRIFGKKEVCKRCDGTRDLLKGKHEREWQECPDCSLEEEDE